MLDFVPGCRCRFCRSSLHPPSPFLTFRSAPLALRPTQYARDRALKRAYTAKWELSGHPVDDLRKYYMLVVLIKGGIVAIFLGGAGQALVSQAAQLWVLSAAAGFQASLRGNSLALFFNPVRSCHTHARILSPSRPHPAQVLWVVILSPMRVRSFLFCESLSSICEAGE